MKVLFEKSVSFLKHVLAYVSVLIFCVFVVADVVRAGGRKSRGRNGAESAKQVRAPAGFIRDQGNILKNLFPFFFLCVLTSVCIGVCRCRCLQV